MDIARNIDDDSRRPVVLSLSLFFTILAAPVWWATTYSYGVSSTTVDIPLIPEDKVDTSYEHILGL